MERTLKKLTQGHLKTSALCDMILIQSIKQMTSRNISKEILHDFYYDMENGNDTETICYHSLICILTELVDRIEKLEDKLDELSPNPTWSLG